MDYINSANKIYKRIRDISKRGNLRLRIPKQEIQQYVGGKEGEELVSCMLRKSFPEMILIDDVYIDISDLRHDINGHGPTMQIDHILISNHVIYIIETKKYPENAEVSGSSTSQTWGYKDNVTRKSCRYNADKQNQNHIDNLFKLFHFENIPVISIVCLVKMNPKNIRVSTQYGQYIFTDEELPIMIEAIEKKYNRNHVDKMLVESEIRKRNIKSQEIEVEHIIYIKLLKRKSRELRKGRRKRQKTE